MSFSSAEGSQPGQRSSFSPGKETAVSKIKKALDEAFARISDEFSAEGITVLMPTYSPSQGRLLSEFNRVGGKAYIAGGREGSPAFKNVSQYGLDFDTTAYLNMFPEGMTEKIVGAIPDDLIKDRKIALFSFIPAPTVWGKHVADRDLGTEIVATTEQDTRLFFENKGNLMHVLEQSGLSAYVIPTEVVRADVPEEELRNIYRRVKNDSGRVVVQSCIENYEPTRFIDSEDEVVACVKRMNTPFKITRFVEGSEANLSFFCANIIPSETGRGLTKCDLPAGLDLNNPEELSRIQAHAAAQGVDASNVFSVTGRATLKAVGDSLLANEPGDSIGNNIGHVYAEHISRQIAEIGDKLGRKMAMCGKVGHAGADLIIDRGGKVWINEINDRQQGPTDQMSADAEVSGIPGLSRMAWFAHFADFSQDRNMALLASLRDHADDIRQQYMTSPGSFYVKVYATHDASFNGHVAALRDLPSGVYSVSKNGDSWKWERTDAALTQVELDSGSVTVRISSGSLKKGDKPPAGAEMFRITGIASGDNAPFVVQDGSSHLNPRWRPMIEQLYTDCFGQGYIQKNPQHAGQNRKNPVRKPRAA